MEVHQHNVGIELKRLPYGIVTIDCGADDSDAIQKAKERREPVAGWLWCSHWPRVLTWPYNSRLARTRS